MSAVCLIDSTIFVEILAVPVKSSKHKEILRHLEQRVRAGESLFLPMATILETGNHIGQNGDGVARRDCAQRFVQYVSDALDYKSPLLPVSFLAAADLRAWLTDFPNHAARGSGLGDLSIIHDWKHLCQQNRGRRVYIWSLDRHLAAHDRAPEL